MPNAGRGGTVTPRAILMCGRDLVRREAVSRIAGDQQFGFKHGVIRDVAYQRLPASHEALERFWLSTA